MQITQEVATTIGVIALFLMLLYLYYDKKRFNQELAKKISDYDKSQQTDTVEDLIIILEALPSCYTLLTKGEIQEIGMLINDYHTIIYHDKDIDNLRKTATPVRRELKILKDNILKLVKNDTNIIDDKQSYIRNNIRLLTQVLFIYQTTK